MVSTGRPWRGGEAHQVGDPRHRAVVVHDLADRRGGREPGEPREIDRRLGLAGALQDAAALARSGKTCPGRSRSAGRVAGSTAVRMVAARSAAEMPVVVLPRASIETVNAVPNDEVFSAHHGRQVELVAALFGQRQADQPAPEAGHEVDRLGSHLLGGDREVALVLAVLVVHQDDHPAAAGTPPSPASTVANDGSGGDGGRLMAPES